MYKRNRGIFIAPTHPILNVFGRENRQRARMQKEVNLKLFKNGSRRLKRADKYQTSQ